MAFVNNFSTSFRYLDFIFGTDDKFHEYKRKLRKAKAAAAAKGMSKEEQDEIERKFVEEHEKAGLIAESIAEQKRLI